MTKLSCAERRVIDKHLKGMKIDFPVHVGYHRMKAFYERNPELDPDRLRGEKLQIMHNIHDDYMRVIRVCALDIQPTPYY